MKAKKAPAEARASLPHHKDFWGSGAASRQGSNHASDDHPQQFRFYEPRSERPEHLLQQRDIARLRPVLAQKVCQFDAQQGWLWSVADFIGEVRAKQA